MKGFELCSLGLKISCFSSSCVQSWACCEFEISPVQALPRQRSLGPQTTRESTTSFFVRTHSSGLGIRGREEILAEPTEEQWLK